MAVMGYRSPNHPVADALETIGAALDGVAEVACWSLSDEQLETLLQRSHGLEGRLQELVLRLIGETDRRQTSTRNGATSTRAAPTAEAVAAGGEAAAGARRRPDRPAEPHEALAAGDLSREHARTIVTVMDTLPAGLDPMVRDKAERQLIGWCRDFDPGEVARLGRRLWEVIDPDGADAHEGQLLEKREREAKRKRHLSFGSDGSGSFRLSGQFDPESAAIITAALNGLAKPMPSTPDGPDPRSPGQRYADALTELCRRQLASGDLPVRGGEKPQLVLTMNLDQLQNQVGSGLLDTGERLSPDTARKLACDAQLIPAVLGADGQPLDLGRTSRTFTPAQRRALGLRDGNGCAFPGVRREALVDRVEVRDLRRSSVAAVL